MLGVRLPKEIDQRLSALASQTKRSKSFYVKEAIVEYLDEYESIYQAVARYEADKKKGSLKTYSLDALQKENGITNDELDAANLDNV